ncbi:testis-expressed protein 2 isoform X3 [Denticeps clupeoides]|uniref:testis-expressed protein 2 isoform X3 n=1 Tax=Denticeps clupeoides TaxID=299321 RepID=UPI0010A42386|nr:testis-expressed protein 2 isoform X3 [Denticeps clupeoides]
MTSSPGGHHERPPPSNVRPPAAPKLHVHRSQSRETITIHFSALGEEEEEEELYGAAMTSTSAAVAIDDDCSISTALEASEELEFEPGGSSETEVPVIPVTSTMMGHSSGVRDQEVAQSYLSDSTSTSKEPISVLAPSTSSVNTSPSKSVSLPSSDKPFLNIMKSLSTDVEPREGVPIAPTVRHRQLMKNLVKSLSTETSQDSQGSYRLLDSRLNLQLFKQFTQPRATGSSDSKTAPTSPITSPDSRFSFKVSEVEARIEDTKRRLSEVMYEPLQLFSKIIGDESSASGSYYRPKALSTSASEITNLASLNGHMESNNNNYSIKEEDGDSDGEDVANAAATAEPPAAATNPQSAKPAQSLALDKCSMSALAKQEDEEFCELYSEDFDFYTDTEAEGDRTDDTTTESKVQPFLSTETCSEDKTDLEEQVPSIPHTTLFALTVIIYGCFVLPLPTYVGGMLLGVALGFMLAIGVVWLGGPRRSGEVAGHSRHKWNPWNVTQLDIKEPGMFKGWMNEIHNYDPETYHATLTHSVFVRLDGSILRLSRPNRNIARRATFNEPKPDVTYVSQKIFDLTDSKIYLVPQSLARKRIWNKKYPICIELAKQDDFMSKAEGETTEDKPITSERSEVTNEQSDGPVVVEEDKKNTLAAQETSRSALLKGHQTLYLFGRTGREKEEWFQMLLLASRLKAEAAKKAAVLPLSKSVPITSHSRSSSRGSLDELLSSQPRQKETVAAAARHKALLEYSVYMANYIPPATQPPGSLAGSPLQSPHSSPGAGKKQLPCSPVKEEETVAWVNALVGRIAWDFLGEKHWAQWVSKKIQMKLSKIRLPYFMNELTLTELDMGISTPRILQASMPSVDHRGLWFDLEISYKGSFLMTLETKMNLARLGKEGEGFGEFGKDGPRAYCLADSDEESSSAGSSDEDDPPDITSDKTQLPGAEGYVGGHKTSKIMRFVDKITKSKYFQKATETEFIKKKMEEVSNTPLLLTVEVQECQGTLAVNIPPPPTDRIWYGFRSPPVLELKARPKLGEREVTLVHVTDWIEKKLYQEFQKILVMPNMDDIWLHIMHSAMDGRSTTPSSDTEGSQTGDI